MYCLEIDVLGWHGPLGVAIVAPTSIGDAKVEPIGGAVAMAGESIGLNKGFAGQQWRPCDERPVNTQAFDDARQYPGGEIVGVDPWENQKSGIIGNMHEAMAPLLRGPADEPVARRSFPGGAGKSQERQRTIFRCDLIADLVSHRALIAKVMVRGNGGIPLP